MCFIVSSYVLVIHRFGRMTQAAVGTYLRSSTQQPPVFYDEAHMDGLFFTMKHTITPSFLRSSTCRLVLFRVLDRKNDMLFLI